MKPNVKYVNLTEMLLAKRREEERLVRQRQDQVQDTIAWVIALCVALTALLFLVSYQEGWL